MSKAAAAAPESDLDGILAQIENLQMGADGGAKPKNEATLGNAAPANPTAQVAQTSPAETSQEPVADLAEFRGEGGEASLEETLATLEEEPASGKSLFDEAPSESGSTTATGGDSSQESIPTSVDELVAAAEGTSVGSSEETAHSQEPIAGESAENSNIEEDSISELVDEKALEAALAEAEARINESEGEPIHQEAVTGGEKFISGSKKESEFSMSNVRKMSDHKPSGSPAEGGLTLSVQGSMTLALIYERENSRVMIQFQDGFLCLQMPDGTEVKIPVRAAAAA